MNQQGQSIDRSIVLSMLHRASNRHQASIPAREVAGCKRWNETCLL